MSEQIIYHPKYNMSFYGLEKLHKFPADKYARIKRTLLKSGAFRGTDFLKPELNEDLVNRFLTTEHARQSREPKWLAQCLELNPLRFVPRSFLHKHLCSAMMLATCGTVKSAEVALEKGKAINLSGGYHHASFSHGEGFCIYPDVPIAVLALREKGLAQKCAIIDLDAHQGNGTERCFLDDSDIFMVDLYDEEMWPQDKEAEKGIDLKIHVGEATEEEYLGYLEEIVFPEVKAFRPEIIFYNAGNDIYEKDPLTRMKISREGIAKRDAMVFQFAEKEHIPIAMVLSGGYNADSAAMIAHTVERQFSTARVATCSPALQTRPAV